MPAPAAMVLLAVLAVACAPVLLLRLAGRRDDRRLAAWRHARSWSRISKPSSLPLPAPGHPVRQVIECGGCGRSRPYCPHCGHKLTVETVPVLERI